MEFAQYAIELPGYQSWGIEIALYLFLGGVGAGALLTSAAALLSGREFKIAKAGAYLAPALLVAGSVLLLIDLSGIGAMIRAVLVPLTFTNLTSWMAKGAWILLATIIVALAYAYSLATTGRYSKALAILALPFGVATGLYTGLLLTASEFVPLWSAGELPLLFLISAVTTGIAATLLLASVRDYSELKGFLAVLLLLLIVEAIEVPFYFFTMSGVAEIAVNTIMSGAYSVAFWLLGIVLGIVVPIFGFGYVLKVRSVKFKLLTLCFALVLLGGLTLRVLFIEGAVKSFTVPLV